MFHCNFLSVHNFSLLFFIFFKLLLFFNAFQLFNVILWALIRLKNTKTDKIEYFRDPGVTWLQIIYLEAFHCVEFFFCMFHCLLYFSYFFHWFLYTIFHYLSLLFIVFQLFNLILWSLIRLKNMKTDKIEYFRDPGVTWLQIIYLEAFHCVDFVLYVSLFLLYFSFFSLVFTIFHYLSLLFIIFQLFHLILWSLIRLKNMKTDKIEYFRDPGVTLLQIIYIYIYIHLEAFHCVDFFPYVSLFLLYFSYSWRIR